MREDVSSLVGVGIKIVAGCLVLILVVLGKNIFDDVYMMVNWESTTGVVADISAYTEKQSSVMYNGFTMVPHTVRSDVIQVYYTYVVDGQEYTGVGKFKRSLSEGTELTIAYNPKNPAQSAIKDW